MSFLHSIAVAIDQAGGFTLGEGPEPVLVSLYVNKLLNVVCEQEFGITCQVL